jgi:hypothetical protein
MRAFQSAPYVSSRLGRETNTDATQSTCLTDFNTGADIDNCAVSNAACVCADTDCQSGWACCLSTGSRTALFCTQAMPCSRLAIRISQGDLSAKGTMFRGKFVLAGYGSCNAFPGAGSTEELLLLVREEPLPPLPR